MKFGLKVPRKILINDLIAGLVMAMVQIPGAVANGILAGVNPVFGLYSMIVGTTVAGYIHQLSDHERRLRRVRLRWPQARRLGASALKNN